MMKPYELIRSDRRTIALEITRDGRVLIRAPRHLPQARIDAFFQSHQDWLRTHLERQRQWQTAHPEPTEAEILTLTARAKAELPPKVRRYAAIMGLHPAGITITGARTRFGSCSSKNRLCFSWRLMAYPDEAIDYVVVHELAHLVHRNHGPAFHQLVASVLPDADARRALLKE